MTNRAATDSDDTPVSISKTMAPELTSTTALNRSIPLPRDTAGSLYTERIGLYIVVNNWLRGALACVSFIAILLAIADYRMNQIIARRPPLVIRISDLGKAEPVAIDDLHYAPKEAEIRYFLMNFVQLHYSRNRATLKDNFARSLYFLEAGLAAHAIEEENKAKTISAFLTGSDDEIDAQVRNVSIEDLRTPPYRATVEFDKVYHSAYDRRETKRERYVANFVFVVTDNVPNNIIPVNPLGLTMTYYREDQAFVEPKK